MLSGRRDILITPSCGPLDTHHLRYNVISLRISEHAERQGHTCLSTLLKGGESQIFQTCVPCCSVVLLLEPTYTMTLPRCLVHDSVLGFPFPLTSTALLTTFLPSLPACVALATQPSIYVAAWHFCVSVVQKIPGVFRKLSFSHLVLDLQQPLIFSSDALR